MLRSAFFFFSDEKRPKLKQEDPNATVGEIAKKLGAAWGLMTPEQKQPYNDQAKAQREEYEIAMAEYRKKGAQAEADEEDEEEEYTDED